MTTHPALPGTSADATFDPQPGALLGVNLPWFFGAYGHDLAPSERVAEWPCEFDTLRAYRPLVEAASLGFGAVRVWLCEGAEGIVTRGGQIVGPHPRLVESIRVIQEAAERLALRVYWTLLDGNAWHREGDTQTHAIVSDPRVTERFAERVAAPIARLLDPKLTLALEVINEPETLTAECISSGNRAPVAWSSIGRAIKTTGDAIRNARPGTLVTAGTMHVFLPHLWRTECALDAVDVHIYHVTGGMPSREHLATYVGDRSLLDPSLPLFAGECGMPDHAPDEAFDLLPNYLFNARKDGYDAAFLWRLERVLIESREKARPVTPLGRHVRDALRRMVKLG